MTEMNPYPPFNSAVNSPLRYIAFKYPKITMEAVPSTSYNKMRFKLPSSLKCNCSLSLSPPVANKNVYGIRNTETPSTSRLFNVLKFQRQGLKVIPDKNDFYAIKISAGPETPNRCKPEWRY